MIRGTTPTVRFTVPFDPSIAKKIWITFSQNKDEVFTIEKDQCTFEEHTVVAKLSQSQTLSLAANSLVQIQMRVSFSNGDMDEALASNILTVNVQTILKDGEI